MLVAVTSCKSDAYYAQKAPGAISMLPRKAPSALKTFHELAVGMKDAYEAVGATPMNPKVLKEGNRNANMNGNGSGSGNGGHDIEWNDLPRREQEGRTVLWDFMGNINFVSNETDIDGYHMSIIYVYDDDVCDIIISYIHMCRMRHKCVSNSFFYMKKFLIFSLFLDRIAIHVRRTCFICISLCKITNDFVVHAGW